MNSEVDLRVKTGKDSYFIADGQRLDKLNRIFLKKGLSSTFIQEDKSVFWVRTDFSDSDDIFWVEATKKEVDEFLATGDKSFFEKKEISI